MPKLKPEIEAAAIVLLGDFNPSIMHPAWLAARELIAEEEAESSEITVVGKPISAFRVNWLVLRVTEDRFQASTSDPSHYPSLGEMVRGIFSFLEFTPVRQMGINRLMHFRVKNENEFHHLGDVWAPKEPWVGILAGQREDGIPGLRSLTMQGLREGSEAKYVEVKVEPSAQVKPGVYVATNEHYEQAQDEPVGQLMGILEKSWYEAEKFALQIASHLLSESV